MKNMNTVLMALFLGISGLLSTSCDVSNTTIEEHYNFEYENVFYTVYPEDWNIDGFNELSWGQDLSIINNNVINNGMVLFYFRNMDNDDNVWEQMPSTKLYTDPEFPELNYSIEFHAEHDLKGFFVRYVVTDLLNERLIDYPIEVKVVVIDNTFTRINQDISHENLMKMIK